jgi:peptidyl-prolyl cis-trans isomerase SurA
MRLPTFAAAASAAAIALCADAALAQTAPVAPVAPAAAPDPAAVAQARTRADLSGDVAAVINDEVITSYDLRQRMLLLIVTSGVQPTEQNLPELQREALRGLIDERLEMQEIRRVQTKQKTKIEPSDKEIDDELSDLARGNNMKIEQLAHQLSLAGVSLSTLREQIRAQSAWRRYMGGRFGSDIKIGETQIKAVQTRISNAASKPQFLVSEILIDPQRVGGMEVAVNGANQLIEQIRKGAPFAAVARQFSSAASANSGGDDGWLVSGDMAPELQATLEHMQPGQLSSPVTTADGVYILLLRDKRAGSNTRLVDVKQAWAPLGPDASPEEVAAAEKTLGQLRARARGCDGFELKAAQFPGLQAGQTGDVDLTLLAPEFRTPLSEMKPGETSAPIRSRHGVHVAALCSARTGGPNDPSKTDIENRLYGEQLSMLSKRFLRDLRNSATVETR